MRIELDSKKNRLQLRSGKYDEVITDLEGLQTIPRIEDDQGRPFKYNEYVYPELGPKTMFATDIEDPFVAEIAGRRWKIKINMRFDHGGYPKGGSVVFEETEESITPAVPPRRGTQSYVFGQPNFIQGHVFPKVDNRSAFLLACIESGWGDSGNENLFVGLDEQGLPCGLYHEFSCC